ncbi:MAG TPA: 2-oxoacid:ferredoxin oxidoreductase subunit beta, partial [Caulobacteraceae bacterium]|nr:2-oxoacid:ferredoxin oxidoreductase subunit beta [Caulobacteraceae bacterium]
NKLDVIVGRAPITAQYDPGEVVSVTQHDGTVLNLRKVAADYDPTDRTAAMAFLAHRQAAGELVTGLLHIEPDPDDLHENLGTVAKPLNQLTDAELVPGAAALEKVNASLR